MKPIRIVLVAHAQPPREHLSRAGAAAGLAASSPLAGHLSRHRPLAEHRHRRRPRRHNWIGLFGAYLSDLLLQSLGLTAFLLPLWLGGWAGPGCARAPAARPCCAGSARCSRSSFCPLSLACCPGIGAGCTCFPSRASSAASWPACWWFTSTSRAHGWWPPCSPPPDSTLPPPSASGVIRENIRRPLGSVQRLARPLAQLARRARRTARGTRSR